VTWIQPSADYGLRVDWYDVHIDQIGPPCSDIARISRNHSENDSSVVVDDLEEFFEYSITIVAVNDQFTTRSATVTRNIITEEAGMYS
jgi:hypothetical protein